MTILAAAALLFGFSANAQQTKQLTADKHNEYGIVYSLPVTQLVFDIEAQQTVKKAGPFYRYAEKYVGTTDVIKEDSESWDITGVRMYVTGIPGGPERTYLMQLKAGSDVSVCAAGEGDGMLLGVNVEVPYRQLPVMPVYADEGTAERDASKAVKAYLQYVDEDFLVSQSSAMRARMLWETLMTVRESRLSLSRGTADTMPVDGRQMELMLNSLGEQDEALTDAFTGVTARTNAGQRYFFTPDTAANLASDTRIVLGRLSDFAGFTDADDLTGDPIYLDIKYLSVPELPVDDKGQQKKLPKDAVMYTIPSTVQITLTWRGRTIYTGKADLAQQGVVFGLDPKLFTDKKVPYQAEFDPSTGALLNIERKEQ